MGETQLLPGEIGRLVRVAFGPEIERRRTRILGSQVSVYRGIRRKVTGNQPTAKRLCLETPSVSQEPASLSSQEEGTSSLSHGHGQEADTSSPTTVKLQKQIRQLEAELRHEKQARQEVQNQLQKVQHKLETHNQTGCISWDKVRDKLDAELLTLEKVGGMISTGPIDKADPLSLVDFTFTQLHDQLLEHAPQLTSLLSSIGQYADPGGISTLKGIHSLAAVCLMAKKNSDHVKGFQLLVSLMLVARATSKYVITDLNHIGVCLSYSQTFRYVEDIARAIDNSRQLQEGNWIVAYDNINIRKSVTHERHARHSESWNFTSRLAIKVSKLPPSEYCAFAGIPQGHRKDLAIDDLLPNDDDDKEFLIAAKTRVQQLLVNKFQSCSHLTVVPQYVSHDQLPSKTIIHPIAVTDIDESYTDNNVTILEEFQKMLAVDDTMEQCVVGDQATCRTIRGARRRRVADVPNARLLWAKENPGDFHFTWECVKVIFLTFWKSADHPGSLAHLATVVNRTGVTIAAKKFQQADEFLMHALEAHLTASLVSFLNIEGTRDTLIHDPVTITQSWLEETAERFTNQVVAVPTDEDSTDTDHIYNCHRSFLHMALLYEDLRNAIRNENGPRIIQHWRMWLIYFLATGRRNYSNEAANLLANLKADFSKWLAYIVSYNRTVNSSGKPGQGKAIDMAVEHHNLVIKTALRSSGANITLHHLRVISLASQVLHDAAVLCDQEVLAPNTGTHHTTTKAQDDIQLMISSILDKKVTIYTPKRKQPTGKSFTTPESQGYHIALSKRWIAKFLTKSELSIQDQFPEEDHEQIDTIEDISTT